MMLNGKTWYLMFSGKRCINAVFMQITKNQYFIFIYGYTYEEEKRGGSLYLELIIGGASESMGTEMRLGYWFFFGEKNLKPI